MKSQDCLEAIARTEVTKMPKSKQAHTPTPWFNDKSTRTIRSVENMRAWQRPGESHKQFVIAKYPMRDAKYPISHEEWEANGDFIITAVNSHDDMVAILEQIIKDFNAFKKTQNGEDNDAEQEFEERMYSNVIDAKAAILKAEGRE